MFSICVLNETIFLFFWAFKDKGFLHDSCMTHATTNACVIKKSHSNKGESYYSSLGLGYWTPKLGE